MSRQTLKVAVAVITDTKHRILITRRSKTVAHPGLWEFPGGKLEAQESPLSALKREIHEEVGLNVLSADFLCTIGHCYEDRDVELIVYRINEFSGQARCCELQLDLRWVDLDSLNDYPFPAANVEIIRHISNAFIEDKQALL